MGTFNFIHPSEYKKYIAELEAKKTSYLQKIEQIDEEIIEMEKMGIRYEMELLEKQLHELEVSE